MRFGALRVVDNQLNDSGELLNFKQGMAQADLGDRAPCRVDHAPGGGSAAAEGL